MILAGEVVPLVCTLSEPAAPSSTAQALAMVRAGLGYLTACDAADLGTSVQAEALLPGDIPPTSRPALQATLLQWGIDLLSGPGGLASYLRTGLLGVPFTGLSQPLDLGRTTRTVPPHLRAAVIARDRHCQFPGCTQPPAVCEAHHLIPWAQGGPTSLGNLALFCRFHHLIVIHRWGWKITRHPDGTTTATSPDGRILHSHSPPRQPA